MPRPGTGAAGEHLEAAGREAKMVDKPDDREALRQDLEVVVSPLE